MDNYDSEVASLGASIGADIGSRVGGPVSTGVCAGFGAATGYVAGALVPKPDRGGSLVADGGRPVEDSAEDRTIPVEDELDGD
jgi:hypothetical protein